MAQHRFALRFLPLLLPALLLGACTDEAPPAPTAEQVSAPPVAVEASPLPASGVVLANLFGNDYERDSDTAVWRNLPLPDSLRNAPETGWAGVRHARVSALSLTALEAGRALLITQAQALDDEGRPQDCHACTALISAFVLEAGRQLPRVNESGGGHNAGMGNWRVVARLPAVTLAGSNGSASGAHPLKFAADRPGFAVEGGFTGQGITVAAIALFELTGKGPQSKVVARSDAPIPIFYSNEGQCDETARPAVPCITHNANWRTTENGELLLEFGKQQAIYRADAKGNYQLASGRNLAAQ